MNGAVQGDATTTASTPDRNAPPSPSRRSRLPPADASRCPTSNTPSRLSANPVISTASPATTGG